MKILITGARGYLASFLIPKLAPLHELILTSHHSEEEPSDPPIYALDLSDTDSTSSFIHEYQPDYIVNTAAVSLPDWAEDHKDETYAANVTAIQNIIQNCRDLQIPLLHMSTDYVFSGNDPPYSEDSLRDPVNYYGQTKVEAEDALENSDIEYLICRTTMLYGTKQPYQRPNPFIDWYEKLSQNQSFEAPENHYTNPTFVEDLADCLVYLIDHNLHGIYHTAGSTSVSRYEFAIELAEVFGFDSNLITPIPLPVKRATRPQNSTLVVEKMFNETGITLKSPREAFQYLKEKLY